ncbi:MAG: hypothetical protein QXI93_01940 [Candidatus Methanomethylicia archaeon]
MEFSLYLTLSILISFSCVTIFGFLIYNKFTFVGENNKFLCSLLYSYVDEALTLKNIPGLLEFRVSIDLPSRFSTYPYIIELKSSNGVGMIVVGEGSSSYAIKLPSVVRVADGYVRSFGGRIQLLMVFHGDFVELYIIGG